MRRAAAALLASLVLPCAGGGAAAMAGGDAFAFVSAFAQACVPQRLSYEGTVATARDAGWREPQDAGGHGELATLLQASDGEAKDMAEDGWTFERTALAQSIGGRDHYLVVTRVHAPDIITLIGCYLYDFDAAAAMDPQPVSDLIGAKPARLVEDEGLVQHTWGPSPARPRTLDTHLTFIGEDSPHAAAAGFSGLVLKFETSEPDPSGGAEKSE